MDDRATISPRRVVLVGGLVAVLVVSGTAFAHTFGSTLAFQQRDEIDVQPSTMTLNDQTVTVEYTIQNPLDRPVEVYSVELVVYEGEPPFADRSELTVRRQAQLADGDTTVAPGETARVTVELPIASTRERTQAAIDSGDAVPSGIFQFRLGDREFGVEVVPRG